MPHNHILERALSAGLARIVTAYDCQHDSRGHAGLDDDRLVPMTIVLRLSNIRVMRHFVRKFGEGLAR